MKDKRLNFNLLKEVFSYMGEMKKIYILGFILASLEFAIALLTPELNSLLVGVVGGDIDQKTIYILVVLFLVMLLLAPLSAYGKYLEAKSCEYGSKNLKNSAFRHIQKCRLNDASMLASGDILTRLSSDIEAASTGFKKFAFTALAKGLIIGIIGTVLLLLADWKIGLIAAVYCLFTFIISGRLNPYVKKLDNDAKIETSNSTGYLMEAVKNMLVIRIFLLQDILKSRYEEHCSIIKEKRQKFQTVNGIVYGIIDILTYATPAIGFLLALHLNYKYTGDIQRSVYIATLFGLLGDATLFSGSFVLLVQSHLVSCQRALGIFEIAKEHDRASEQAIDTSREEYIKIDNLDFHYQGSDRKILDGINLSIKRGERVAFVGKSGCGKSTLVKIISGLYEVESGTVSYTGIDSQKLSLQDIRDFSSYIPQDNTMFTGTVSENLLLGKPDAKEEAIREAAKLAQADIFIDALENGYDTFIGEDAGFISGGQKQRLAIARALIKNAPVFVFDEATSALDGETEGKIIDNLADRFTEKTFITIAHRLSTIQEYDCIYVMDKGRIAECGKHKELIAKNGLYRQMWDNPEKK